MELVLLIAVTMGVIGLVGRLPEARLVKRDLARTRLGTIASLADGKVVTLRGTIALTTPEAYELSPISGHPCVYWLVTFDELGVGGDYRELGRAEKGVPFELHTETGSVRVVPSAPRLGFHGTTRVQPMAQFENPQPDALLQLAHRVCKAPNYRRSSLRTTEILVTPGMTVTVKGLCTYEPDPTVGDVDGDGVYRGGERPTRPVISGSRRDRMSIG